MKYIVKVQYTSYGYLSVEADSKTDAMNRTPYTGQAIMTDSNYIKIMDAKPYENGDLAHLTKKQFNVVRPSNLLHTIRKWVAKHQKQPYYQKIATTPPPSSI